ncbi:MAG: cytochrome c oxidase subunit 3 family protein [Alphaproteobacteria bacterium]|nr:cytochrome c oxidase subunit 3 family protein [Alphaproteobacteria bacterium]
MNAKLKDNAEWGALSALPGNPMIWILIISELVVFGLALIGFMAMRFLKPEIFATGQAALDYWLGGLNTMFLITSGWCAARAVHARSRDQRQKARLWLGGAGMFGAAFLVVKLVEWSEKLSQGHDIESDAFFTLFYLITGFHAAHVVMGLAILAIVGWWDSLENLKTGTAFWHMVDLIWLIIFPVIYLARGL